MANTKIVWKHDYGDHEETLDSVMWVNGKPTSNCVSPCTFGCYSAMLDGYEIGIGDTIKECKEMILERLGL